LVALRDLEKVAPFLMVRVVGGGAPGAAERCFEGGEEVVEEEEVGILLFELEEGEGVCS